jgi:hypothetical protein
MPVVRYTTQVDPGVSVPPHRFADEVAIYLADPGGWASLGYTFVVGRGGKHIRLSTPQSIKQEGCKDDALSCAILGGDAIWLNAERWLHGAPRSQLPLAAYRQYMVTHEMGHALGYDHVACPGPGQPAPLMLQQTLGLHGCTPNTRLTATDRQSKQR